jgi:hypothetical protein
LNAIHGIRGNNNAILEARKNRREGKAIPSLDNKHLLAQLLNSFQENKLPAETKDTVKRERERDRSVRSLHSWTLLVEIHTSERIQF